MQTNFFHFFALSCSLMSTSMSKKEMIGKKDVYGVYLGLIVTCTGTISRINSDHICV